MNVKGILTSWAGEQRFGNSEQFARVGIELSGNTGWFAPASRQFSGISGYPPLAPAAQVLPRGGHPRHATRQSADATDELSRPPGQLSRRPSQLSRRPGGLAGLTDESAGRPGHPAGPPGELAGRPGRLSRRPGESDGRPSEPDGPGAARRPPTAARREGMHGARRPGAARGKGLDGPRRGLDGPREHGLCALARAVFVPEGRRGAPPRHGWSIARAVFVPEGRRCVATGGASRSDAEPVDGTRGDISCPGGAEGCSPAREGRDPVNGRFLRPCRGGPRTHDALHGLRDGQSTVAPPVATALDPSGVEDDGTARAVFVPEGRWGVATGGASRSDAEPVDGTRGDISCPGGAEGCSPAREGRDPVNGRFLRPCRGGPRTHDALHGLRDGQSTVAPPVATALDPSGVERRGDARRVFAAARAIGARARAGDVLFRAGEVPEGRPPHTPLGHQRTCGSEVRRG